MPWLRYFCPLFRVMLRMEFFRRIGLLLLFAAFLLGACREEEVIAGGPLDLRFSADTLLIDTGLRDVGSGTYVLKVYNDRQETVRIGEVVLRNPNSGFRINLNGQPGVRFTGVEILPRDSIYVFVEVTVGQLNNGAYLAEDDLLFRSGGEEQRVKLVAPARDAIFYFPDRFLVLGQGDGAQVIPYSVLPGDQSWDPGLAHVVYGYLLVDSGRTLTIRPGTDVFFHENSGLWIFDEGRLRVAPGAVPGQGDSVTFSSDRLEPGFADNPGQWGGILGGIYIAQGGRAEINNAVIKNATTGLRTDSARYADQLILRNSYLLNHSRTALLAGYSNIRAENVVLANCGLYTFYAFGGNYNFVHCTFANYWSGSVRQEPAVLLANFLETTDANGQNLRIVRDLESAYFGNCLIYGNNQQELVIAEDPSGALNYRFNHGIIRVDSDPAERGFDLNDANRFTAVAANRPPGFIDPEENNYGLDSLSQAVDQGNATDGASLLFDIRGNNRNFGGLPDLGAIERQN